MGDGWTCERAKGKLKRKANLDYIFDNGNGKRIGIQVIDEQPYENCRFLGVGTDDDIDTVGLILERDGTVDHVLLFRPDEAIAAARVLLGACWSEELENMADRERRLLGGVPPEAGN